MIVRLHTRALEDAEDAETRLDQACVGLGQDFADLLRDALVAIRDRPRFFGRVDDVPIDREVREYYIRRFMYRVIYAVTETELLVVAVAHAHRRPGYWLRRLTREG